MKKSIQNTTVNFYIVKSLSLQECLPLACKIITKAYSGNNKIFIHTMDPKMSNAIDEMLWTMQDESFIAHTMNKSDIDICPVFISDQLQDRISHPILINLSPHIYENHQDIDKLVEFICEDDKQKEQGRKKYSFYKKNDCEVNTYNL